MKHLMVDSETLANHAIYANLECVNNAIRYKGCLKSYAGFLREPLLNISNKSLQVIPTETPISLLFLFLLQKKRAVAKEICLITHFLAHSFFSLYL